MSTTHDSDQFDLALYEQTKDMILRDVMVATSHADLDSTAMAMSKVSQLLDATPWTMWDELGVIVLTLQPLDARESLDIYGSGIPQWVSSHAEAEETRHANHGLSWTTVVVTPAEAMQTVIASRRSSSVTESGWDRILDDVLTIDTRSDRRRRVLLAVGAVLGAIAGVFVFTRPGGAAATPSCSLRVIEIEDDAIVWGYTPHDSVVRGVHLPGGAWVPLAIGGRTRTPIVTEIGYPSVGDRIVVADLIRQCSAPPVTTTTTAAAVATTTEPAVGPPTTTVTAITPAPTAPLPPATWTVVPPATSTPTADVLPPVTAPPSGGHGQELPRTGRGLTLWGAGLFVLAVGVGFQVESIRRNTKES